MPRSCRRLRGIERLDEDRTAVRGIAVALQGIENGLFQRQADPGEVRRVLGFRVHTDPRATATLPIRIGSQLHDFIEGGDGESSVKSTVPRPQFRQPFPRAQVLISAMVKSSVNQPVVVSPSMTWVRRRSANSGCCATSVVPPISFSCRATNTPSRVITRSGSM